MRHRLVTVALLAGTLASCSAPSQNATSPAAVVVEVPVVAAKRAAPAPPPGTAPSPSSTAGATRPSTGPSATPLPTNEVGTLSIPALDFRAVHTETIAPDTQGVVRPTTRDGLARVRADGVQAELWAVHSGGRAGDGPGGVLTARGAPDEFVGATALLPDGSPAVVTDAWVSDKNATVERLDTVLGDPSAVVLVTCQVQDAARSSHNVVLTLRRHPD